MIGLPARKLLVIILALFLVVSPAWALEGTWTSYLGHYSRTEGTDVIEMWNYTSTNFTFFPRNNSGPIWYLVIGSAGSAPITGPSGGGGAGGFLEGNTTLTTWANITIGTQSINTTGITCNGGNTSFGSLTAYGGGCGGIRGVTGNNGASGGGAGGVSSLFGGSAIWGAQGNNGGGGSLDAVYYGSGGGAGRGAAGSNGTSLKGGNGGLGRLSSITGSALLFSEGGGGSYYTAGGAPGTTTGCGGEGGGGAGKTGDGYNGTPDHGCGGGGAFDLGGTGTPYKGGSGSTGIVVARYTIYDNFNANVTSGAVSLSVRFRNVTTVIPAYTQWDFGDGATTNTTEYYADHTYTTSGNYTVSQNVSVDGTFQVTTKYNYIVAGYATPIAAFSASDTVCVVPCTVTFTDLTTNSPTAWKWDFGDYNASTLKNPTWVYDVAGYKNVNLTSYNPAGSDSENKTAYIYVAPAGSPDTDFSGSPTSGSPSLLVTFTDLTSNSPTSWNWSFGDGTFSTGQNPQHVYAYSGLYTVSLAATNGIGTVTETKSNYITVATSQNNVWYSPYQIQLKVVDTYGVPIIGAFTSISYISSSLPNTDISWMIDHYGITAAVAEQMTNSSVFEQDYTGDDGTMTFTGFSSIRYNVSITNATIGLNHQVTIMPKDTMYVIYCPLPGQTPGTDTLTARRNVTLPWYKINSTAYKFELRYQDTTACTSGLVFNVSYRNGTAIYNEDLGNPGTSFVITNHTMISPGLGYEVLWRYNATRTC